jgi:pimeloyl-ACP methyl ester carboxylesterase
MALSRALLVGASCAAAVAGAAGQTTVRPTTAPAQQLQVLADGHPLALWSKRPTTPQGAILLLHGGTWSARPNFDLQVDRDQRSVMDAFVRRAYAVYALDLRGYGATPRDSTGWLTPTRAAKDVSIVLDWIRTREGKRPVLVGYSRGSYTSLLTAQLHPDSLSMLVLYAFLRDLDEPFPAADAPAKPPAERTTAAMAASDFVLPDAAPKAVADAYVRQALAADPVRSDWRLFDEFNAHDPSKVRVPTLVIRGGADPRATVEKDMKLLSRLATEDKSLVILPRATHVAHVEDSQSASVNAILAFIERPRTP